jgi:hypothetical protein
MIDVTFDPRERGWRGSCPESCRQRSPLHKRHEQARAVLKFGVEGNAAAMPRCMAFALRAKVTIALISTMCVSSLGNATIASPKRCIRLV